MVQSLQRDEIRDSRSYSGTYIELNKMSEWIRMLQVRGYNSNIRFGKFLLYEYIVPDNYNIKNILYIHRIFQKCTQIAGEILTQNMGEPPKPLLRTSREHICSKQWSRISTQNMFWNSKTNVLSICPALYIYILDIFRNEHVVDELERLGSSPGNVAVSYVT